MAEHGSFWEASVTNRGVMVMQGGAVYPAPAAGCSIGHVSYVLGPVSNQVDIFLGLDVVGLSVGRGKAAGQDQQQ
jgi:hypothetical protein